MSRLRAIAACAALVLLTGAAAPPRTGIYADICASEETGDYGGMELRFALKGGQPAVSLNICEGGCHDWPAHDARLEGDTLTFLADDVLIDGDGTTTSTPHPFTVRFKGAQALLSSSFYGQGETYKLRWRAATAPPLEGDEWPRAWDGNCR